MFVTINLFFLYFPFRFYVPVDLEWLDKQKYENLYRLSIPPGAPYDPFNRYPAMLRNEPINQTLYYSTANADIAKALGTSPNVTQTIVSEFWPPANKSLIYNNSTLKNHPAAVGSGLFGAIPVRYLETRASLDTGNQSSGARIPSYRKAFAAMPQFIQVDKAEHAAQMLEHSVRSRASYFMSFGMGFIAFEALDLSGAGSVKATLQLGKYTYQTGIRQLITMSQLTSAMVKFKYAGKYILSQGIRALPYEYDYAQDDGANVNAASTFLFPFALSFLMPIFVTILVEEKENRLRVMMAMVTSGYGCLNQMFAIFRNAHEFNILFLSLVISLFIEWPQELFLLLGALFRVHDHAADFDTRFRCLLCRHQKCGYWPNRSRTLGSLILALVPRPSLLRLCARRLHLQDSSSRDLGQFPRRALGDSGRNGRKDLCRGRHPDRVAAPSFVCVLPHSLGRCSARESGQYDLPFDLCPLYERIHSPFCNHLHGCRKFRFPPVDLVSSAQMVVSAHLFRSCD